MKKLLFVTLFSLSLLGCSSQKLCATDEILCSGACVSKESDAANCGACGKSCASQQACLAGSCVACGSSGLCQAEVYTACFNSDDVRAFDTSLVQVGPSVPTSGEGPISFSFISGTLYVADSVGGVVDRIAGGGATPVASVTGGSGFNDLEALGSYGGLLYVSNAAVGTFVAIDPVQEKVVGEVPLTATGNPVANPLGFDFANQKAYVAVTPQFGAAPYTPNAVAVVDLSKAPPWTTLPSVKLIDLTSYAAAGAVPGASDVIASTDGTRVFVSLNDLYDSTLTNPVANAHGKLVVIDTATDEVVGSAVDLGTACLDPSGMTLSGSTLFIGCGYVDFSSNTPVGGAILPVDVSGSVPVPGTAIPMDHAIGSLAICDGAGYAGATDSGALVSFNPSTSSTETTNASACPPASSGFSAVFDVACAR
jgi:hypothetical protein